MRLGHIIMAAYAAGAICIAVAFALMVYYLFMGDFQ